MLNKPARVVCALLGLVAAVSFVGVPACGADPTVPVIDCKTTMPKKYSDLWIIGKCTNCHASSRIPYAADPIDPALPDVSNPISNQDGSRHGAPPGIDFDTYESTKTNAIAAERDIAGVGPHLMEPTDQPWWTVDGGGPSPTETESEKTDFYAWVQCGEPN